MKRDHWIYQLRNLDLGLENQDDKTNTSEHTGLVSYEHNIRNINDNIAEMV